MSYYSSSVDSPDDNHTYYNIQIYNSGSKAVEASFKEIRTTPLVKKPSDWHLSVIRWTLPLQGMPINYFPVDASGNPLNTEYKITLRYNSVDYVGYLVYNNQNSNNDFGIYSYTQIERMINKAFYDAYILLVSAVPSLKTVLRLPPYMRYNALNSSFDLYVSNAYVNCGLNTTASTLDESKINIFFNKSLYLQFDAFSTFFTGWTGNDKNFKFIIQSGDQIDLKPTLPLWLSTTAYLVGDIVEFSNVMYVAKNNNTGSVPSTLADWDVLTVKGLKITSETPTIQNMSSIRSVAFTTSLVPVKPDQVANSKNATGFLSGTAENTRNVITDFEYPQSSNYSNPRRGFLQYSATVYRYVDMQSDSPLNVFDIGVYWLDNLGIYRPVIIPPNESVSIKIMFSRKNQINS